MKGKICKVEKDDEYGTRSYYTYVCKHEFKIIDEYMSKTLFRIPIKVYVLQCINCGDIYFRQ